MARVRCGCVRVTAWRGEGVEGVETTWRTQGGSPAEVSVVATDGTGLLVRGNDVHAGLGWAGTSYRGAPVSSHPISRPSWTNNATRGQDRMAPNVRP